MQTNYINNQFVYKYTPRFITIQLYKCSKQAIKLINL